MFENLRKYLRTARRLSKKHKKSLFAGVIAGGLGLLYFSKSLGIPCRSVSLSYFMIALSSNLVQKVFRKTQKPLDFSSFKCPARSWEAMPPFFYVLNAVCSGNSGFWEFRCFFMGRWFTSKARDQRLGIGPTPLWSPKRSCFIFWWRNPESRFLALKTTGLCTQWSQWASLPPRYFWWNSTKCKLSSLLSFLKGLACFPKEVGRRSKKLKENQKNQKRFTVKGKNSQKEAEIKETFFGCII